MARMFLRLQILFNLPARVLLLLEEVMWVAFTDFMAKCFSAIVAISDFTKLSWILKGLAETILFLHPVQSVSGPIYLLPASV